MVTVLLLYPEVIRKVLKVFHAAIRYHTCLRDVDITHNSMLSVAQFQLLPDRLSARDCFNHKRVFFF